MACRWRSALVSRRRLRRTITLKRSRSRRTAVAIPWTRVAGLPGWRWCTSISLKDRVIIYRSRRQRTKRLHVIPRDCHRRTLVARGQRGSHKRRAPVHGNHWNRFSGNRLMRGNRARNAAIADGRKADVGAAVESHEPPRLATAHPRRPPPSKAAIEIPGTALIWQIAP